MKQTLGIILDYPPGVLKNGEGLSRLLMFLIGGCLDSGNKVIILCPEWCRKDLTRLVTDFDIATKTDLEIQSTGTHFPLLTLYNLAAQWGEKPEHSPHLQNLIAAFKKGVHRFIVKLGSTPSFITFFLVMLLFILSIPLVVIIILLYLLGKLLVRFFNRIQTHHGSTVPKNFLNRIGDPLPSYRNDPIAVQIFQMMDELECKRLATLANNHKDVGTWLITTPFWPGLVQRVERSVVVCPDIIITDFPVGYSLGSFNDSILDRRKSVGQSLKAAKKVITFSDYVKKTQVIKQFGISEERISVIPHGDVSLITSLNGQKPFETLTRNEKRDLCLQVFHNYLCTTIKDSYVKTMDFSGIRFLIFTSQVRPHKNLATLIQVFHRLLWERHEPIKLVLTGNVQDQDDILALIEKLGIKRDVIILPGLPVEVMAALNHLSALSVNPTLFEGGFPFTFSEAYSMGSPSVMSMIPVVEEYVTDPDLQKAMLFDPYDIDDMVERIYWGLHHREELLALEQSLYNQLRDRTWGKVAQEYLDVVHGKN